MRLGLDRRATTRKLLMTCHSYLWFPTAPHYQAGHADEYYEPLRLLSPVLVPFPDTMPGSRGSPEPWQYSGTQLSHGL